MQTMISLASILAFALAAAPAASSQPHDVKSSEGNAALTGQEMRWDEALALPHRTMPEKLAWDVAPPVVPDKNGQYPIPVPGMFKLV